MTDPELASYLRIEEREHGAGRLKLDASPRPPLVLTGHHLALRVTSPVVRVRLTNPTFQSS